MSQKKILIVGSGIAGLSIAYQLYDKGHQLTIIDSGKNKSSRVAAGFINPMVFRRMTKSWRLDEFLPFAETFYKDLESKLEDTIFFPITIRRIFSSEQERNYWLTRQNLPEFSNYLNLVSAEDNNYNLVDAPHGTGRVKNSSYIASETLMNLSKIWLEKKTKYILDEFQYAELDPQLLTYKGEKYDSIVFCQGVDVNSNPYFQKIQVDPTKGEMLIIKTDTIPNNESLNRKCFVLPLGDNKFCVGSTYVWNTNNDDTTEEGKNELIEKLKYITVSPYEIVDQKAGIRPTTPDRRPLMGEHPEFSGMYLFNGLGTKGFMMAPLLAKEMIDFIVDRKPLSPEVDFLRQLK